MRSAILSVFLLIALSGTSQRAFTHDFVAEPSVSMQGPALGLGYGMNGTHWRWDFTGGMNFMSWLFPVFTPYLQITGTWRFARISEKVDLGFRAGMAGHFLRNRRTVKVQDPVRTSFQFIAGVPFSFRMGKGIELLLEPDFMFFWDSYYDTPGAKTAFLRITTGGLRLQLRWGQ